MKMVLQYFVLTFFFVNFFHIIKVSAQVFGGEFAMKRERSSLFDSHKEVTDLNYH